MRDPLGGLDIHRASQLHCAHRSSLGPPSGPDLDVRLFEDAGGDRPTSHSIAQQPVTGACTQARTAFADPFVVRGQPARLDDRLGSEASTGFG